MNDDFDSIESRMLESWDAVEAHLRDLSLSKSEPIYQQLLNFICELRMAAYDQWFSISILLNNIRLMRGKSAVFFIVNFESNLLTVRGIVRHRFDSPQPFEFELNPICLNSQMQALLEQLMLEG